MSQPTDLPNVSELRQRTTRGERLVGGLFLGILAAASVFAVRSARANSSARAQLMADHRQVAKGLSPAERALGTNIRSWAQELAKAPPAGFKATPKGKAWTGRERGLYMRFAEPDLRWQEGVLRSARRTRKDALPLCLLNHAQTSAALVPAERKRCVADGTCIEKRTASLANIGKVQQGLRIGQPLFGKAIKNAPSGIRLGALRVSFDTSEDSELAGAKAGFRQAKYLLMVMDERPEALHLRPGETVREGVQRRAHWVRVQARALPSGEPLFAGRYLADAHAPGGGGDAVRRQMSNCSVGLKLWKDVSKH